MTRLRRGPWEGPTEGGHDPRRLRNGDPRGGWHGPDICAPARIEIWGMPMGGTRLWRGAWTG